MLVISCWGDAVGGLTPFKFYTHDTVILSVSITILYLMSRTLYKEILHTIGAIYLLVSRLHRGRK